MKEFNKLLDQSCISTTWLSSLLKDTQKEIWARKTSAYKAGLFFDKAFGLELDSDEVDRLGKFIKTGEYAQVMENYKNEI
jgi:hypothetical protein